MGVKRENERFLKKLPVEVSAENRVIKGTTVRVSEKGFFVRAQTIFNVGTSVDVKLYISEENLCHLRGTVKFAEKSALTARQNGMGIELTERKPEYLKLIRSLE